MAATRVQHVNKASSDELLQKFSELGSENGNIPTRKPNFLEPTRRKRSRSSVCASVGCESLGRNNSLVEWRSLLPPSNRKSGMLWKLKCRRSELKLIRIRGNRFFFGAAEKTWRKTIDGASKMFMKKHCQRHVLLKNEVV